MNKFKSVFVSVLLFVFPLCSLADPLPATPPPPSAADSSASIILSMGTKVELLLTRPVWVATAKAGDKFYAQTSFPVLTGAGIAIPAGTYVEGAIESVTRPTRRSNRAEINVLFTKIVFADGYVAVLPGDTNEANGVSASAIPQGTDAQTLIAITIQTTTANDLLLDNGAEVEMTLGAALALDPRLIAQAIPLSRAPDPQQQKSATRCTYIPGSPGSSGTPDIVIPGSPGTPSTTIPGGPGMPDTVIPGSPGIPDTVVPGSPSTPDYPGIACPPKPIVISCAPVERNKQARAVQPVPSH